MESPKEPATVPHLARARDIATRLDVSERTVYTMAAQGLIPSIKVGRRSIRFNVAAVMAALSRASA